MTRNASQSESRPEARPPMVDAADFGEAIHAAEVVSHEVVHWAIEQSRLTGRGVYELLVERAPAAERDVYRVLADFLGVDFEALESPEVDKTLTAELPSRFALAHLAAPLRREGRQAVVVTSRPETLLEGDEIATRMGRPVRLALAAPSRVGRFIQNAYGLGAETVSDLAIGTDGEEPRVQLVAAEPVSITEELDSSQEASVTRFVNRVLFEAVSSRASDIHIEPYEEHLRVRFRIDGVLQEVPVPPAIKRLEQAIISRVKVLGDMDIAEKRLTQDGQIRLNVAGRTVDVRVSVVPSIYGESLVLRILDRQQQFRNLGELGMPAGMPDHYRSVLSMAQGLVLVTGPTGSGKTTTLYALLNYVNEPGRKIITIEDPVEYRLEGITQIQVKESIGLNFSNLLRSIVRHDPDVIMVGEIRDVDTANIALNAAITGHLVLATLHTSDAPTAVSRLVSMGAAPYLVASALKVVLAQRLVRLICPHCRVPEEHVPSEALSEFPSIAEGEIFRGAGCEACRHTGYRGRSGVFESLTVTPEMAEAISAGATTATIREQAARQGLVPLREAGARRVQAGETTFEELYRVTRETAAPPPLADK